MRFEQGGQGVKGSGVRKTVHCSLFTVHHFPTLRERAGFTLLEIMMALAVIGIILLTVIYTVNYHAQLSYEHTLATRIFLFAKEKIADMEMNPKNGKGISPDKDFSYENIVKDTNNNNIIELKTMVKGYGKEVTLNEFVIKKEIKN
ncbi:MAG: type II secretion system protein [Nitrospirae bacterium]|nr:type II secretion system protein [Nitrospirota bacterium]